MIEIMIVIAIIAVLVAIAVPAVSSFRERQTIKNATEEIVNLLGEARTNTLASKNATFYSVRFDTNRAVLFAGSSLNISDPDTKILAFDSNVTVLPINVSLQGSGYDVIFDRFTGNVATYGTIKLELISNPSINKIITVNRVGAISSN